MSVKTSANITTGLNQWDEVWEQGGIGSNGSNTSATGESMISNVCYTLRNINGNETAAKKECEISYIRHTFPYSNLGKVTMIECAFVIIRG